ncbi:MAG: FimV/HubP family polar landmark protein [Gammaproteobacteria bacterium]
MRQIRLLLLCLGLVVCLAPPVWALGLGPIRSNTEIGQYFYATIPILNRRGSSHAEGLKVRLASYSRFKKMGLSYPAALFGLRFRLEKKADGQRDIVITSNKPIRRPFLTFLLDVQWPSGRLIRQYTVLLNPPLLVASRHAPRVRAVSLPPPAATPRPAPVSTTLPTPVARTRTLSHPAVAISSIHHIVGPVRQGQTLWGLASRIARTPARTDQVMLALYRRNPYAFVGNINRLRQGAVLKVPPASRIRAIPVREAIAFVVREDRSWRTRRFAGSHTARSGLVLLTPSGHLAKRVTSIKGPAEVASLQKKLKDQGAAVARLSAQLRATEARAAQLQHLLTLKSQALAALAHRKPQVSNTHPTTGFPDVWWWIAGLLILALLVAFGMRRRAHRTRSTEVPARRASVPSEYRENAVSSGTNSVESADLESVGHPAREDAPVMDLEEKKAEETFDPFTDVNFQIAYGLYDRAIETLLEWVKQNPQQRDVHLKLLEVYAAAERPGDYVEEARRFRDLFGIEGADWSNIAERGKRLAPEEPLFAQSESRVQTPAATPGSTSQDAGSASHVEDIFDELMGTPDLPQDETLEFSTSDTGHIEPLYREADIGSDTNTELKLEFELAEFDPQKKAPGPVPQPAPASPQSPYTGTDTDAQKQFDESMAALSEHTGTTFVPGVRGETMVNTKLDLAKAYIEMGDKDSARSILEEVLEEGSESQKAQAQDLIHSLGA